MQLDEVTAEIRPRSDWEAVDLGLALVRRDFWRCFSVWWLAMLIPSMIAGWLLWDYPAIFLFLFWWWKPAGSRMVLFELSRRLFGERPSWRSVWREIPRAWWRRFFHRFVIARFSPWMPVTLAVEDLEGLRGKAYRQRCSQIGRRGDGVVMGIYFTAGLAAAWWAVAILLLLQMLVPQGQDGAWQEAMDSVDLSDPTSLPLLIVRVLTACLALALSLTDVFVTGAGFGIYINNRTWIEGWDVELAFKRMAQRLSKVAVWVLGALFLVLPLTARAQTDKPPAEVIREVKAQPEFKVHTVKEWVPKKKKAPAKSSSWLVGWLDSLFKTGKVAAKVFFGCAIALIVGLLIWAGWKFRHVFVFKGGGGGQEAKPAAVARVVMGMAVTPESLPGDVPASAWLLWQQGRQYEALGLLYRGAISQVIETGRVEIQESDTEGDCLQRVELAGADARPEFFRGVTRAWTGCAYGGTSPGDGEVRALCEQWPYAKKTGRSVA